MNKIINNFNNKGIIGSVIFSFAILMMIDNSLLNQASYADPSEDCSNIGGTWDNTACNIVNNGPPTQIQEEACPSGQYRDPLNGLCYEIVKECKDYSSYANVPCSVGCEIIKYTLGGGLPVSSLCTAGCKSLVNSLECTNSIVYPTSPPLSTQSDQSDLDNTKP